MKKMTSKEYIEYLDHKYNQLILEKRHQKSKRYWEIKKWYEQRFDKKQRLTEKINQAKIREKKSRRIGIETPKINITKQHLINTFLVIIMLICILTFAATGEIELENIAEIELNTNYGYINPQYHEIKYTQNYEEQFNDFDTTYLDRVINLGKTIEEFGENSTWLFTIDNLNGGEIQSNNWTSYIIMIGNVILVPLNLIIQITGLTINSINALIGKPMIKIPSLLYRQEITPDNQRAYNWWNKYIFFWERWQ